MASPLGGTVTDERVAVHSTLRAARWAVHGDSKVLGDVEILDGEVQGLASVKGNLTAARLVVDGTLEVDGETKLGDRLRLDGRGRFGASLAGPDLSLSGSVEVVGSVTASRTLAVSGKLGTGGSIQAGSLTFRGRIASGGNWSAASLDGRLAGHSTVEEVQATTVRLRRDGFRHPGRLTVRRIDARDAYLEGVEAEYLHAERVELGPDCHIAEVEGPIIRQHRSSHVGFEVRSEAPRWLTR
jgi:cytoskeletal protein CcmA (bactofilin family)